MAEQKNKQGMDEIFRLASSNDNEAQIRHVLEELEKASITHYNFKKFVEQWGNTRQIVLAQIENEYSQYVEELETYRELKEQPRIKGAIENRVAPLDIYDAVLKMHFRARQIISWKFIEAEMGRILITKLSGALGEVKAIDVEREVLNRIQEMEQNRNSLFLEIMTTRFEAMDSKFLAGLRIMQENDRVDKKENMQVMANALVTNSQIMQETIGGLAKSLHNQERVNTAFDFEESIKPLSNTLKKEKTNVIERLSELQTKTPPKDIVESIKDLEKDLSQPKKKQTKNDDKLLETQDPKELFKDDLLDN
jgi:hypothetical protein